MQNKKIKLLIISHTLDNTGAPNSLLQFIKKISANDYELKVFSMMGGDLFSDYAKYARTTYINYNSTNKLQSIYGKIKGFLLLFWELCFNRPDHILINSSANFRALLLSKFFKIDTTVYVREFDEMYNRLAWLRKKSINFANKIIAVSSANKEWMINFGIPSDKIFVIGNGIDFDELNIKKQEEPEEDFIKFVNNKFTVATIGRINKRKGFDYFLEIMKLLNKHDDIVFVLIGDYATLKDKENYEKIIKDYKLEDKLYVTKFTNNIFKYLKYVDHVIIPSRTEAFSRAILEALALEIPVSCFKIGGNMDIVGVNYPLIRNENEYFKIVDDILNIKEGEEKLEIDFSSIKKGFDMKNISKRILEIIVK